MRFLTIFKKKKVVELKVVLKYNNSKYYETYCSSDKFDFNLHSMIESVSSYYDSPIFTGLQINGIEVELKYKVEAYNNKTYYSDFECVIPKCLRKTWGL